MKLNNFLLVLETINKKVPFALQNSFTLASDTHSYRSRGATHQKVSLPKIKKVTYGENSISYQPAKFSNNTVTKYSNENPLSLLIYKSLSKLKILYTHL